MTSSLEDFLQHQVDAGRVPGAVAVISRPADGTDVAPLAAGRLALDGPPMPVDAVIRIQSLTKIVNAVAALRLVEAGRIALDDPVLTWLPELGERQVLVRPDADLDETLSAARDITLRHLLTNTGATG